MASSAVAGPWAGTEAGMALVDAAESSGGEVRPEFAALVNNLEGPGNGGTSPLLSEEEEATCPPPWEITTVITIEGAPSYVDYACIPVKYIL